MAKYKLRETEIGPAVIVKIAVPRDAIVRSVVACSGRRRIKPGGWQEPLKYTEVMMMIQEPLRWATYYAGYPILQQLDEERRCGEHGNATKLYEWAEGELIRLGIFPPSDGTPAQQHDSPAELPS